MLVGTSCQKKRSAFEVNGRWFERLKVIAAEGAMVSLIGKISYDLQSD